MFPIFVPSFISFTLPFSKYFRIFVHSCICSITVLRNNKIYFSLQFACRLRLIIVSALNYNPHHHLAHHVHRLIHISFTLSLNLLLNLHFPLDALSFIRDCIYLASLTLRRPKDLCLALLKPLRSMLVNSKAFLWFCVVFCTSLTHLLCCRHIIAQQPSIRSA